MKKISLFLILLFNLSLSYSQTFEIDWLQCYGTEGYDEGYDLIKTTSGYYLLGVTEQKDIWLCKTDFEGNLVWDRKYGGSKSDYAVRLLQRNSNSYYIIGGSFSSDGDISNDPFPNSGDIFIINVDSSGNIIWDEIYGGYGNDVESNAIINEDGSIIISASTTSCDGDISSCYGIYDWWILKIDSTGQKIWDLVIGSTTQDWSSIIVNAQDGGYLVGGWTGQPFNTGGNITCLPLGVSTDILLVKIDSFGIIEWQQCYGGTNDEGIMDIIGVSNGFMLLCMTNSGDGDVNNAGYHFGYVNYETQSFDIWVINIDFQGNYIWSKCYGGSSMEGAARIFTTPKGFRIFGDAQSFDGDVQGNHSWSDDWSDIWTLEIDSVGNLLSNQCFGSFSYERLNYGVEQLNDYEYTIAGYTQSYDWSCSGELDIILMKITDTLGVGIKDNDLNNPVIVYPNPANEFIMLENNKTSALDVTFTDIYGVKRKEVTISPGSNKVPTDDLITGLYFLSFKIENRISALKIIVSHH